MDQATAAKDPLDFLMNAGSSPDIWLFVGGPVLLLLAIVLTYTVLVTIRNRRERAELKAELDAAGIGDGGEDLSGNLDDDGLSDLPTSLTPDSFSSVQTGAPTSSLPRSTTPLSLVPKSTSAPKTLDGSEDVAELRSEGRGSWLARLTAGLAKTRQALSQSLEGLFKGKVKLDADVLEKLHEALYRADVGVSTADKLVDHVRTTLGKEEATDWDSVKTALIERATTILEPAQAKPLVPPAKAPWVILIVGVNGVGKTTTISKLAAHFLAEDKKVLLAAADTFRAAAIEQLSVWGDRLGIDVIKHQQGSDPAAVAYDGVKAAIARHADVLLIDTAGRLHAKAELMAELGKINRVIGKDLPGAPQETWLVLDATTGQNAIAQVKAFGEVVTLTGLIITKLDGTAKGGVVLALADQFGLPIRFLGVGEKAADLRPFQAADYAGSLF